MSPPLSRLVAARWPRVVLDLAWIASFGVLFTLMVSDSSGSAFSLSGRPVELTLSEGMQRQGLFKGDERLATVIWRVKRRGSGWRVTHRFLAADPGDTEMAVTNLDLRKDLSLAGLGLDADLSKLGRLSGLASSGVPLPLRELGRIRLSGSCSVETGDCSLRGSVGRHRVDQVITAGRGPVVTSAIYPLLAKGSLGGVAELRIFDPMTLSQRMVELRVEGREQLRLRSGETADTLRVRRDLEGLATRVWIDRQGRVMKEELPMGLTVEHEAWAEAGPPEGLGGGEER